MSEQIENVEDTGTPVEPSPIEQRALEMGWRPKEEFDGEEADFIPAEEFVRRKPLFDRIESQSKQIKSVHKALEALKSHFSTVREAEYTRALKALKSERRDALSSGDAEKFEQLDDEIKQVEQEAEKLKDVDIAPVEQDRQIHPEFSAWMTKNPWYSNTGYMKAFADDYGTKLAAQGMSSGEVLKAVEAAVKKEFPHKFKNPNKEAAPHAEAPSSSAKKGGDTFELSEQERKIMNTLVGQGVLTKEQYIKQLKDAKGVK